MAAASSGWASPSPERQLHRAALAAAVRIEALPKNSEVKARAMRGLSQSLYDGGACVGSRQPNAWYPQAETIDAAREQAAPARKICASCPVRTRCLALSLLTPAGRYGVWGGLVEGERKPLRAELVKALDLAEARRTGQPPRDLLADLAQVIGEQTVPVYLSTLVPALCALAPGWPRYRHLTVPRLVDLLDLHAVPVVPTGYTWRVDPADLRQAIAARSAQRTRTGVAA